MDVLVPFAAGEPKTRLDDVLEPDERRAFARAMLQDVCDALVDADATPTVLSTESIECSHAVVVDDRALTEAVNARLDPPIGVVMADLAIVSPRSLERLFEATGDVVIAPGLGGGTNAIVTRHQGFNVDYHGASVRDHCRIAASIDAEVTVVDSFRLAVDVDEPRDLVEVLLHGEGRAAEWVDSRFDLATTDGRVTVVRN